jgi:hypothetical protein
MLAGEPSQPAAAKSEQPKKEHGTDISTLSALTGLIDGLTEIGREFAVTFDVAIARSPNGNTRPSAGNKTERPSDHAVKNVSESRMPIFSGNRISVVTNVKVEIHITNSANNNGSKGGISGDAAPSAPAAKPDR